MNEPNPKPDVRRRFFSDVEKEALGWFWHRYMKSKTPWLFLVFVLVAIELLSNLVFEGCWSCGGLAGIGSFNSVLERDPCDDFGEIIKAA